MTKPVRNDVSMWHLQGVWIRMPIETRSALNDECSIGNAEDLHSALAAINARSPRDIREDEKLLVKVLGQAYVIDRERLRQRALATQRYKKRKGKS